MKFVKERVNVICQELAKTFDFTENQNHRYAGEKRMLYYTGRGRCIKRAVDIV